MDQHEEEMCTPSEITQVANNVTSDLLPVKSKKLYMNIYTDFLDWCSEKNVKNYTENVFIAYFSDKSNSYKASTLWSYYSMLKTTFNINKNIDISKFTRLIKFLKRTSENYQPKKSEIFTLQEIEKFIDEAPDKLYLMMKVVAIFGISGACRCHELSQILIDDIQDAGSALIINIRECKNEILRTFTVVDNKDKIPSFLQIYRKYVSLRPPETDHRRFFIYYRNDRCTKQPVGINQFGKIPSLIASFLNLPHPDTYTGHCFRRSSATLLADSGANTIEIKRHGGSKSSSVTEGYNENSLENKIKTTQKIFGIKNQQLQDQPSTSQAYPPTIEVLIHEKREEEEQERSPNTTNNHETCKKRWESLRAQYRKVLRYRKTKAGEGSKAECKWKLEDQLDFLRPHMKDREYLQVDASDTSIHFENSEEAVDEGASNGKIQLQSNETLLRTHRRRPLRLKRKQTGNETAKNVFMKYLLNEDKKLSETFKSKDELDYFFDSIKCTIRKFSDSDKYFIRQKIFNLVSEIESKYVVQDYEDEQQSPILI